MIRDIINFIKKLLSSEGIYFVGSTDKLPEPLTKEDEVKYVELSMAEMSLLEINLLSIIFV